MSLIQESNSFLLRSSQGIRIFIFLVLIGSYSGIVLAENFKIEGWSQVQLQKYEVMIQTPTKLEFFVFRDAEGKPFISGSLKNDKNKGIGGSELSIRLPNGKVHLILTETNGLFKKNAIGWPRRGRYSIVYKGKENLGGSRKTRVLDLSRVDVEMKVLFPSTLRTGEKHFSIAVHMAYQNGPLKQFPVSLLLERLGQNELSPTSHTRIPKKKQSLWPLMTLRSDQDGELRFLWEGKALKGPARLSFVVAYAGNRFFLPQKKRFQLLVIAPPSHQNQEIFWGALGLFLLLGGTSFSGLKFFYFLRNLRERQKNKSDAREMPPILFNQPDVLRVEEHKKVSKPDFIINGWLLDCDENEPIADAHFVVGTISPTVLHKEDQPFPESKSDEKGRFSLSLEGFEQAEIKIHHPFYHTKIIQIRLPHYGSGRKMKIEMYSYKQLIFNVFSQSVWFLSSTIPIDPKKNTAREILKLLTSENAEQLRELAFLFESAYYGPKMPGVISYKKAISQLEVLKKNENKEVLDSIKKDSQTPLTIA